jgi:Flp pilus assembly protein TadD
MMLASFALSLVLSQAPAPVDPEIAFWSARVERDKDDHISATKLGYACLKAARKTGDFRLYTQGERAFTEALRRSPGHYTAVLGLATARAARHRFREAIDLARSVAASQPKDADAHGAFTHALATNPKLDRNQEAREFLSGAKR